MFRALARPHREPTLDRLRPLIGIVDDQLPLAAAFDEAHARLRASYRNEYVYKNELVSKLIFGKHSPRTATALLEVQMGASEADVLVVNGTTTVYEVKTDLDQFTRLPTQLRDYATRAEHVNLVVSEGRAAAAESHLPSNVGLLARRKNGAIRVLRDSTSNLSTLEHDHLYRLLRREEAVQVLAAVAGYEPDVPRGRLTHRMRLLFRELDIATAHAGVVTALRSRGVSARDLVRTPDFPKSLRAMAYATELSVIGRSRLLDALNRPVASLALENS